MRGIEGRQRVQHVAQRFDVDPARAQHHHRAELRVIDHAEQHLDAARRNHRRDAATRGPRRRARSRYAPSSAASSRRSSRTPSSSVL